MATQPTPTTTEPDEAPTAHAGQLRRYPVAQADGSERHQVILVVTEPDEGGTVRGFPLGYEHEAGQFRPADFSG